jgi:signal transduction histidine kinase/CheY-like chemotaxis protein
MSASRIGAGALDQRIEVRTGDELEALADEFNRMSAQLRDLYGGLELKVAERTRDLARALDEQTATSEVLATMSRNTRDFRPVLASMLFHAKRLCRAEEGFIFRREADTFLLEDAFGAPPEVQAALARLSIGLDESTLVGRVALDGRPVHIPDVLADREYGDTEAQRRFGYRTLIGVPLLRDGEVIGVLGLGRDRMEPFSDQEITLLLTFADQTVIALENVRLFEEIEEKSRQLELASQHKSEFLAHMSHELRTPLNSIIGFSDVLLERMFGPVNEKQEEYLNDILSSGHHLLSLINDVLDLSKVEAGRMELELAPIWLPEVLEGSVAVFRETATRRNIRLDLSIDPRLGPFEADERKLKQILLNLMSNGIKFTPDGGRVEVSARLLGDVVHIAVRDTGIGVSSEDLERIFDAFQQVHRPGEPREGTGLGLTLTKQFVEMHGGRIWLESAPGLGSTFTFTLPANPISGPGPTGSDLRDTEVPPFQAWGSGAAPSLPVKAVPEPTPLFPGTDAQRGPESAATVLTIDDDPMALELVRAALAPAGYRVLQASSPTEGLRLAREQRPSLVVLDLLMPGMDGFEVVERLRADPATNGVPILVLTAKVVTSDEVGRLRPRISHLADKAGFRTAQFLEIVGRLVGPAA